MCNFVCFGLVFQEHKVSRIHVLYSILLRESLYGVHVVPTAMNNHEGMCTTSTWNVCLLLVPGPTGMLMF